ncbi:MAG: vitamin K epoxide reductase family protein [Acidobacteriota bacterium]
MEITPPPYGRKSLTSWQPEALLYLLERLGVPVSRTAVVEAIYSHPGSHTTRAAADALESWNVGAEIQHGGGAALLERATLPALVYLKDDAAPRAAVLDALDVSSATYFDPAAGKVVTSTRDAFDAAWLGFLVACEPRPGAGEPGLADSRRSERLEKGRRVVVASGFVALALGGSVALPAGGPTLLFSLKLIGVLTSLVLVLYHFSPQTRFGGLCYQGRRANCRNVLRTPAAKLWGLFPMADIGLLYFAGTALALVLGASAPGPTAAGTSLGVLALLNLAALPYTFFSVFYQARIARTWCSLCLTVQSILWLEFFVLGFAPFGAEAASFTPPWRLLTEGSAAFQGHAPWLTLIGLGVPLWLWLAIRPWFQRGWVHDEWRFRARRLQRHPEVLKMQLSKAPIHEVPAFEPELKTGVDGAPYEMVLLGHPDCPHCARVHSQMEDLTRRFPDRVSLRFLMLSEPGADGRDFIRDVLALRYAGRDSEALAMLDHHYRHQIRPADFSAGDLDPDLLETYGSQVEDLLKATYRWADERRVAVTPKTFVNGVLLPEAVEVRDLDSLIARDIAIGRSSGASPIGSS